MFKKFTQISLQINKKKDFFFKKVSKKKRLLFNIPKRQKFIISVIILSLFLFFSEQLFGRGGIYVAFILAIFTVLFIFWAERLDLKANFSPQVFILPLFYTLSCALFYFLVPARLITRITMASLYALGLYSLLLSENIFIVSSIRTIALLSSARTVSFIVTLVSYFFMANVVFSLHLNIFITMFFVFLFTFPLVFHSIWSHTLERSFRSHLGWAALIALCITETALTLWFWPTTPTLIGLFLTGLFYILVGISQIWLDKRLFKSVMWEYLWVVVIIFLVFVTFSTQS
jgi:hypothetical protein